LYHFDPFPSMDAHIVANSRRLFETCDKWK
jgi:hypothetical protein